MKLFLFILCFFLTSLCAHADDGLAINNAADLKKLQNLFMGKVSTSDMQENKDTPKIISANKISEINKVNDDLPSSEGDVYVTLIRFAWQQLFAPSRLLNNPLDITRAPMQTLPMTNALIYGDKVYAHPEVSWTYQNTYVTAVELRNKYPHPERINLRKDLCGDWQAVALYPRSYLKASGNKESDNTVLFLISKKPFNKSMEVCNGLV